jgi:hypothetical protein
LKKKKKNEQKMRFFAIILFIALCLYQVNGACVQKSTDAAAGSGSGFGENNSI